MQDSQLRQAFKSMSLRQILAFKKNLDAEPAIPFDRLQFNRLTRERCTTIAAQHDAHFNDELVCMNRGHDWHVRSQAAWDAGYDEPVVCWSCGAWDM